MIDIGNIVKIRDWKDLVDEYGFSFDDEGVARIYITGEDMYFLKDMKKYCGREFKVKRFFTGFRGYSIYRLCHITNGRELPYYFTDGMFEYAYSSSNYCVRAECQNQQISFEYEDFFTS